MPTQTTKNSSDVGGGCGACSWRSARTSAIRPQRSAEARPGGRPEEALLEEPSLEPRLLKSELTWATSRSAFIRREERTRR